LQGLCPNWLFGIRKEVHSYFRPLEVLLSPEHQEAIATNGNFVQHLLRKVRMYDPETQIVVGYQGQALETYSVIVSFDEG
jgi:hypothetical protein